MNSFSNHSVFLFSYEYSYRIFYYLFAESSKEWYKDIVKALRRKSKIEFFHRDDMAGENIDEIQFEKHL